MPSGRPSPRRAAPQRSSAALAAEPPERVSAGGGGGRRAARAISLPPLGAALGLTFLRARSPSDKKITVAAIDRCGCIFRKVDALWSLESKGDAGRSAPCPCVPQLGAPRTSGSWKMREYPLNLGYRRGRRRSEGPASEVSLLL